MDGGSLATGMILGSFGGMFLRSSSEPSPQNTYRLRRIERKLDLILDHLGLKLDQDDFDEVRQLMLDGQKIPAIKLYREITGAGLKEAKDAVEEGV
jgi:hypothetical protein